MFENVKQLQRADCRGGKQLGSNASDNTAKLITGDLSEVMTNGLEEYEYAETRFGKCVIESIPLSKLNHPGTRNTQKVQDFYQRTTDAHFVVIEIEGGVIHAP